MDPKAKKITIATLNALSGPAAMIGKPFGVGKQVLIKVANDPKSKLLKTYRVRVTRSSDLQIRIGLESCSLVASVSDPPPCLATFLLATFPPVAVARPDVHAGY